MFDLQLAPRLYRKLLTLYPQAFRQQLGESLAQTFNDLYKEQKNKTVGGLFVFVLWMFLETGTGILKEHILVLRQRVMMKKILTNHNSAAITSSILALPLGLTYAALMFNIDPLARLLTHLFTGDGLQGELQINMLGRLIIFGGLLLLPVALALNLRPMLKRDGTDGKRRPHAINLIVGAAILLLFVFTWGALLVEEISCLQGVRCD